MPRASPKLRAELARRIRSISPHEWRAFVYHWIAFNAIYGGEPDHNERARVMSAIRRYLSETQALHILRQVRASADLVSQVPPGDMRRDRQDPKFRAASSRYIALYRDAKERPQVRLSALAGVLYQVRCNLVHGSKDPDVERDRMLVRESLRVLQVLLPELEKSVERA